MVGSLLLLHGCMRICVKLVKHFTEVGWAWEFDLREELLVSRKNICNTVDTRILGVSIERETVQCLVCVHMSGNTAKSESGEYFVRIIWLQNGPNLSNRGLILVSRSHIVEWVRLSRLTIRACKVNRNRQRNLPAWSEVINEAGPLLQFEYREIHSAKLLSSTSTTYNIDCGIASQIFECCLGVSYLLTCSDKDDSEWNTLICTTKLCDIPLFFFPVWVLSVAASFTLKYFRKVIQILWVCTLPLILDIFNLSRESTTRASHVC